MFDAKTAFRKKACAVFAFVCAAFLLVSVFLPLKGRARITSSVLRFHVVADSDAPEDQELKEDLRASVLDWTKEGLSACRSVTQAQAYLEENRPVLERKIDAFLSERGAPYGALLFIGTEYHAAKTYDEITLPQGEYLTFRITLGRGEGHNFFCVLFPPICQNAARRETNGEVLMQYGFSSDEVRRLEDGGGVKYRFFLWDLICGLFEDR